MPSANHAFATASFRHSWRDYQARVLGTLDAYLDDRSLHVVAPPGSGKTVLGLEVVARLRRPALVLTPTLTIREQWLRRLGEDFFAHTEIPPGLSRDLVAPGWLTVSTYQALATETRRDLPTLVAALRAAAIGTLVVDEAHHLRNVWWRSLERLRAGLEVDDHRLTVVALTATPPYDVPAVEWSRYASFCGPVDEEIGVPELVRAGDLCPHQDCVFLSLPSAEEAVAVARFRQEAASFVSDLALDGELATSLADDPHLVQPREHLESLIEHSEWFLAVAVFLGSLRWEAARGLLSELGLEGVKLPPFDTGWAETLMQGLLHGEVLARPLPEALAHRLREHLESFGAIERRQVRLLTNRRIQRDLRDSRTKINAVCQIVEEETRTAGPSRRVVVLADHIRASAFASAHAVARPLERLGVVPLFEALRRRHLPGLQLGVLTGSLAVVPAAAADALRQGLEGDAPAATELQPLPHDPTYLRLAVDDRVRRRLVEVITGLFEAGEINGLVGTAALLGEGWDAPAIDTLVLATIVGSHVRSNQMRGRALRSQPGNPTKAAVIWHLGCVETAPLSGVAAPPSADLLALERRFSSFVGPGPGQPAIESGLARLGIDLAHPWTPPAVAEHNGRMFEVAAERLHLVALWRRAVGGETGARRRLVGEVEVPLGRLTSHLGRRFETTVGRRWLGGWHRWLVRRRLRRISGAVWEALASAGSVVSEALPRVETVGATAHVSLTGASYREQVRFVDTLLEVFDLLASPRYLLRRGRRAWAVPTAFGVDRAAADRFASAWRHHAGRARLIYTRSAVGRRELLGVKERALLERSAPQPGRRTRWR